MPGWGALTCSGVQAGCGGLAELTKGLGVPAWGSFGEEGKDVPRWSGEDGRAPVTPGPRLASRGEPLGAWGMRGAGERCGDGDPTAGRGLEGPGEEEMSSAVALTRGSFNTCT